MTADVPTILATSGGLRAGHRTRFEFSALSEYAVELSGVTGRAPRVCFVATAIGDDPAVRHHLWEAAHLRGWRPSELALFPMPNVDDIEALLLDQDVVWVLGGSVAGLLAMWRLHGVDVAIRTAWTAGVVMTGVSAGSICWHAGGTTDSFGPDLRPVTDGLAMVPYSNGVHYDSEAQRRPLFQRLIADRTLPPGYATDDGAGILYRGTDYVEAVTENNRAAAYYVDAEGESRLEVRRL
ncbi:Type 1 glutamine amidotransferase-like domain-containing protein [Mycolicibacterium baixiangningiae]|uniref:Type 1 glutamine amidotransferase-like domain-containing protein n=1 Tax=Mycolicibacterium baixiangningiae TaxID=2761578 RepID=UPI0018675B4A|nr:peptidase E [Mycolicibacterium baixiangningiae]